MLPCGGCWDFIFLCQLYWSVFVMEQYRSLVELLIDSSSWAFVVTAFGSDGAETGWPCHQSMREKERFWIEGGMVIFVGTSYLFLLLFCLSKLQCPLMTATQGRMQSWPITRWAPTSPFPLTVRFSPRVLWTLRGPTTSTNLSWWQSTRGRCLALARPPCGFEWPTSTMKRLSSPNTCEYNLSLWTSDFTLSFYLIQWNRQSYLQILTASAMHCSAISIAVRPRCATPCRCAQDTHKRTTEF